MSRRLRKTERVLCSSELLEEARKRIEKGESKRKVAASLGMAESTLRKRLKRTHTATSLGRYSTTFSKDIEIEFCNYVRKLDNMFYGMTAKNLRILAYEFAEKNNIPHRFNREEKIAGKDWLRGFMKRNSQISLRQPTSTSLARAMGFNKPQCDRFYDNLSNLLEKHGFPPHAIYNMDESGFTTVPNKPPKVLSQKGKRCVNKISSAERGVNVTVVCAMSAGGHFVPPTFIYPRKKMKPEFLDGSPPCSIGMVSDSSYINSDLFVEWLSHFKDHTKPTKDNPILLILDNHSSHCTLPAVDFCRANHIILLSLPPHSSHRLQPLDRCFFSPLKQLYAGECEKWMRNHPGRLITIYQIASIFAPAYLRAATIANAVEGFRVTGISPFNKYNFTETDFLASSVTERPLPETTNTGELQSQIPQTPADLVPQNSETEEHLPLQPVLPATQRQDRDRLGDLKTQTHTSTDMPSTSKLVPITSILPVPKTTVTRSGKRKSKRSEVMSSSPFKQQLIEEQENRKPKPARLNIDRKNKNINKKKKTTVKKQCRCPGCKKIYKEPIVEDWIQCISCAKWWHEKCTPYSGTGQYKCSTCE